jgi:carboxynorspermidine decarboxylase
MGITIDNFTRKSLEGISGLHFHTLCEQNSDDLVKTLESVEEQFGEYLHQMKWLNFGGGHHITREDYDLKTLIASIKRIQAKYGLIIYLEPGEAVALKAGFLVSTVLDVIYNGMDIAILDTSAACHMPDVLEMPYRPEIIGALMPREGKYTYRLGGPTCLAGDIIGDYSFSTKLQVGDRLVFCDMAIYSMVKNNTFNGMNLPGIALKKDDEITMIKTFGYEDFKNRLS